MGTTNLLDLDEKLLESIGEWRQHAVTTAMTADTLIICTELDNYTAVDNHFNDYWVYIEDQVNAGESRLVSDYSAASSQITVLGANFSANTTGTDETFRIAHYSWANRKQALNDAIREVYPYLHRKLEDRTLVTGSMIPDNSFELWTASTASVFCNTSSAALERTTTAGLIRGALGTTSMKVTPSAASGYAYISSDDYPRLLDLADQTVDFKAWAYPEVTDDPSIVIYTKDAAGSTQTLASTTSCSSVQYTLIELENQDLNDDLETVELRFVSASSTKYCYFDSARITGPQLYTYLLLSDFADGSVSQVYVQTSGVSDDICDDLHAENWERVYEYTIENDGTYRWLRLRNSYTNNRQILVIGDRPLGELSATTDTISLDGHQLNMLIEYAAYRLFEIEKSGVSSEDKSRYEMEAMNHLGKYRMLQRYHSMPRTSGTMRLPSLY